MALEDPRQQGGLADLIRKRRMQSQARPMPGVSPGPRRSPGGIGGAAAPFMGAGSSAAAAGAASRRPPETLEAKGQRMGATLPQGGGGSQSGLAGLLNAPQRTASGAFLPVAMGSARPAELAFQMDPRRIPSVGSDIRNLMARKAAEGQFQRDPNASPEQNILDMFEHATGRNVNNKEFLGLVDRLRIAQSGNNAGAPPPPNTAPSGAPGAPQTPEGLNLPDFRLPGF